MTACLIESTAVRSPTLHEQYTKPFLQPHELWEESKSLSTLKRRPFGVSYSAHEIRTICSSLGFEQDMQYDEDSLTSGSDRTMIGQLYHAKVAEFHWRCNVLHSTAVYLGKWRQHQSSHQQCTLEQSAHLL